MPDGCASDGKCSIIPPAALETRVFTSFLSRRKFSGLAAKSLALGVALPALAAEAEASLPLGVPADAIQINANENPYGPSPRALAAITRSEQVASRYPSGVAERLTDAIARFHSVRREQVAVGCGSTEILRAADAAFLGPEKNVVVAEPTFEAVVGFSRVIRAQARKIPLTRDFRSDLRRMAAACDAETGVVYVCNPNNPTGTIVTRAELDPFFGAVPSATVILVDEAYFHFVSDRDYASAFTWLDRYPNLLIARTFSKVYGLAGMRLGYGIGQPALIHRLRANLLWNNTNAAVLPAALASLADPDVVPRNRRLLNGTRDWLCAQLDKDRRRYIPSHANFVMIFLDRDVAPIIEQFRARNILVGRKFPSLPQWLRVSIGTRAQMQSFLAALREIAPAV